MIAESRDKQSLHHLLSWLGLGLVLLVVYLLTPSQQYDADVLGELKAINRLDVSSPDPAHMLYVRLGVPVYRLWLALGYQGDALVPMQVMNAFCGAGAIMMFALVLQHYRVRWALLLLICAAAALSYAFWTHTVDAFFIIPAALFALTALASAAYLSSARSHGRRGILVVTLGISLSLAALKGQCLRIRQKLDNYRCDFRPYSGWCLALAGHRVGRGSKRAGTDHLVFHWPRRHG